MELRVLVGWQAYPMASTIFWPACQTSTIKIWLTCQTCTINYWPTCQTSTIKIWPTCQTCTINIWLTCQTSTINIWLTCQTYTVNFIDWHARLVLLPVWLDKHSRREMDIKPQSVYYYLTRILSVCYQICISHFSGQMVLCKVMRTVSNNSNKD